MGFWSSITSTLWHVVSAIGRIVIRLGISLFLLGINLFDLLLGFLTWPEKKMRLHIFILSDPNGPLISEADLTDSLEYARQVFKDRYNVKLILYGRPSVEVIKAPAPNAALDVDCGAGALGNEFGEAGDYFAGQLAGWNVVPVSLTFPITAFVVRNVKDKIGCSLGPLTDYLVISPGGVKSTSTLAHEMGHACNLWHSSTKSNLMFRDISRGNGAKWFQKNLLRSSRHVLYW